MELTLEARVLLARRQAKVNNIEVAKRLDISAAALSNIENGKIQIAETMFATIIAAIDEISREKAQL
jgi:transcriptional regulator with XRE-family HTH domain